MEIYEIKDTDIVYSAAVDFGTRTCSKEVHIVQYDNSLPIVAVKLYSSGGYYALPSGYEANLRFSKKDKTFIYKPVLGCDKNRTTVYFVVDEQMSLIAGDVYPIIELTYNGSIVGSSPITFIIDRNPIQIGDIESKSDYPAIVERISAAETKATNAKTLAEEAKASADDVRDRMIDIGKTYATKVELSEEKTRAIARENEIEQKISQTGKVDDVQVNGESVVQDRVANIDLSPYAKTSTLDNYVTLTTDQTIFGEKTTADRLRHKTQNPNLPDGYSTATVTIASSGIDTGISVASLSVPTIETEFKMISKGDYDWFGTTTISEVVVNIVSTTGVDYICWGRTSAVSQVNFKSLCDDAFHVFKIQSNSATSHSFYVDGVLLATKIYDAAFTNTNNIYIGRGRSAPTSLWKSFKIINDGDIIFNGIACRNDATGAYGFYDTVNKTFRTANVGVTGIVSDVDYYALTNELPKKLSELDNDVGYITENGVMMYDSFDKFPTSGNAANIYLAKDTNYTYRYDSILKTYIEVSRPYEELTEVSTDIIVNGKLALIIGDVLGAKVPD